MKRGSDKVFSKEFTTNSRREYIDYDYIEKLDDESREWLARFSDEYYGATFIISDTYVKRTELITHLKNIIPIEKVPQKKLKLEMQLELFSEMKDKFIKVSNNSNRDYNVDLRKLRAVTKYYKNDKDQLVADEKYKYSQDNIHPDSLKNKCNKAVNSNQRDLMAVQSELLILDENDENIIVENYHESCQSPEDLLHLAQLTQEYETLLEKGVL